jgi:FkbM family methyltransferase
MKNYVRLVWGHKRPVRFLMARLLMATGACRWLTIPQRGFILRFHPANLSSQLWIDPHERDDSLVLYRAYLQAGDRIVDVGANIGQTVLAASAQVGVAGRVMAIEPHPRTFKFLQENIALNEIANVELFNVALGANAGSAAFSDDRRDDMNRIDGGPLQVAVSRLDDLIQDPAPIALLKVDVEGYEKFVFTGATKLLQRTQCVYFEVSELHFRRFGYTIRDLLLLLEGAGFRLFRPQPPDQFVPISAAFATGECENLLALRDAGDFMRRTGWAQASRDA